MTALLSALLLLATLASLTLVALQTVAVCRHLAEAAPTPSQFPGLSILKPLCGVDDDLEANLAGFLDLDYPDYELLLGVVNERDSAYAVALRAQAQRPERVRVVLQRGEPGQNPKVNQLVTLASAARHGLLVVSDSNVRVRSDYLREIAAHFEDPEVALVTHPIAGGGARRLGSRIDALYLGSGITGAMAGGKRILGKDYVIGKSMALRQSDLRELGGFATFKDVLAEDFVIGRAIGEQLGKKVALAHHPVTNVTVRRAVGPVYARYERWSVMQRHVAGRTVYACQLLLHPTLMALAAAVLTPNGWTAIAFAATLAAKTLVDAASVEALGCQLGWRDWVALPVKDCVASAAFLSGLFRNTVDWRGHRLRVLPGSVLEPLESGETVAGAPSAA